MKGSEIVVVVHKAIDREKDAISLYLKLAKAVKDPKAPKSRQVLPPLISTN